MMTVEGGKEFFSDRIMASMETAGVFLDGNEPAYADFVVGAWLKMMEGGMGEEGWRRLRSWQGGFWGRVADALNEWSEIK